MLTFWSTLWHTSTVGQYRKHRLLVEQLPHQPPIDPSWMPIQRLHILQHGLELSIHKAEDRLRRRVDQHNRRHTHPFVIPQFNEHPGHRSSGDDTSKTAREHASTPAPSATHARKYTHPPHDTASGSPAPDTRDALEHSTASHTAQTRAESPAATTHDRTDPSVSPRSRRPHTRSPLVIESPQVLLNRNMNCSRHDATFHEGTPVLLLSCLARNPKPRPTLVQKLPDPRPVHGAYTARQLRHRLRNRH